MTLKDIILRCLSKILWRFFIKHPCSWGQEQPPPQWCGRHCHMPMCQRGWTQLGHRSVAQSPLSQASSLQWLSCLLREPNQTFRQTASGLWMSPLSVQCIRTSITFKSEYFYKTLLTFGCLIQRLNRAFEILRLGSFWYHPPKWFSVLRFIVNFQFLVWVFKMFEVTLAFNKESEAKLKTAFRHFKNRKF